MIDRTLLTRAKDLLVFALPGTDIDQGGGRYTHGRYFCEDCYTYEDGGGKIKHSDDCRAHIVYRLTADIEAELAKRDSSIRMYARIPEGNTQTILASNLDGKANATLILDDGVEL